MTFFVVANIDKTIEVLGKPAVVGDRNNCAVKCVKPDLECLTTCQVKVVRWFVEE